MTFSPLRIELDLATPVIHSEIYPMHLDGLLFWTIQSYIDNSDEVQAQLDRLLMKTGDVYRASQALYAKSKADRLTAQQIIRLTRTNWSEYDGQFPKTKKSIKENEGIFRKRFDLLNATGTKKVVFFAVGDQHEIQVWLNSIMGIGRQTNSGFGEIEQVTITSMADDWSWFMQGRLNRIIPLDMLADHAGYTVRECRYKPNYKSSPAKICAVPEHTTIICQ